MDSSEPAMDGSRIEGERIGTSGPPGFSLRIILLEFAARPVLPAMPSFCMCNRRGGSNKGEK